MKFYRVFRNGDEGVGEVFTTRELAIAEAQRHKREFKAHVQGVISRSRGGAFIQDVNFVAFGCDINGVRDF